MYQISNRTRRDIIKLLLVLVEVKADKDSLRLKNQKRLAGLLVKKLNRAKQAE